MDKRISELPVQAGGAVTADDIYCVVMDPLGAHASRSAVLNRIAAVCETLPEVLADDLTDDDLILMLEAGVAKKIRVGDLGPLLNLGAATIYSRDKVEEYIWANAAGAVSGSVASVGCGVFPNGSYTDVGVSNEYGRFARYPCQAAVSSFILGHTNLQFSGRYFFPGAKVYYQWRVRLQDPTDTRIWLGLYDGGAINIGVTDPGVEFVGFGFSNWAGDGLGHATWQALVRTGAGPVAYLDTGVALDSTTLMLLELETDDAGQNLEFRINGTAVPVVVPPLPTSPLASISYGMARAGTNKGFDFYLSAGYRAPLEW
jgi:hypothetical protein